MMPEGATSIPVAFHPSLDGRGLDLDELEADNGSLPPSFQHSRGGERSQQLPPNMTFNAAEAAQRLDQAHPAGFSTLQITKGR